jgi:hypothetical protein
MTEGTDRPAHTPVGHNQPPQEQPSKLQALQLLLNEHKAFVKATPKIETEEQANAAKALLDKVRAAWKAADEERKANNAPHETAIEANQSTYRAPLKEGKDAGEFLKKIGGDYLTHLAAIEAEKKRKADEEARKAREEEERKRRIADEELAAGNFAASRAATKQAEAAASTAALAGFEAKKATEAPRVTGGGGRALTQRTTWHARITDYEKAAAHFLKNAEVRKALEPVLVRLGSQEATAFKDKDMAAPGMEFYTETKAV